MMLDKSLEKLKHQQNTLLEEERNIVKHINENSAVMSVEQIQAYDAKRKQCVDKRHELAKRHSVLSGVLRDASRRGSGALETLSALLSEESVSDLSDELNS
jgi:hypothetical protein